MRTQTTEEPQPTLPPTGQTSYPLPHTEAAMVMMSELVYFAFADGIERTIDHMYVTNTTYAYSLLENGDGWMIPGGGVTDECWFKIIAYGYNAANQLTIS